MRICLLGPFPPLRGGISQFNSRLADALELAGHQVVRVGFRSLYPGFLFPGKSQYENPGAVAPRADMPLLRPTSPFSWPGVRRKISSLRCDAVVVQWWHPFFAPCLSACLPGGIPSAAVCHNLHPHEGFPFSEALGRHFLNRMDSIVVHGEADGERAASFRGRVVRLFHPIYDQYLSGAPSREEARSRLEIPDDSTALLFFGLVRRYKGLDIMVQAMKLLPEKHVLIAAGENYGSEGDLAVLAAPLGGRFLRFNTFIPDVDVGLYFRAADIVVLPYRTATQSGVAQIGLAFRKPMVVTNVGSLGETVSPGVTGEIAEPDPKALAEAVTKCRHLLDDPELDARVGEWAERFSWKVYAEKLVRGLA
ncbi:MAG: glycosyltransferase family 4 protein [Candidatus Fermentibacteraceae bacterium]